jgi:hypothetical protein
MTHDDIKKLGFKIQPDGSYSRPSKPLVGRISYPKPQPIVWPALDRPQPREEKSPQRTVLRITRRSSRMLDADNFAGGCKPLIDQVRYAGLIPDDSPDKVEITFTQEKVKKGQEGTLIELIANILDTCLD